MHVFAATASDSKHAPGTAAPGFSRSTYDQLKQQVHQLKEEQKGLQRSKVKEREVESAALLQQKQQYEERLNEQAQELALLQQRLKDSLDRAGRVRLHNEKEKKNLAAQVQKLEAALDAQSKQHQQAAEEAQQRHLAEVQQLQRQLDEERQGRAHDREALEAAKQAFIQEVEEWSQGEVEAIGCAAQQQVDAAQQEAQHVADKCDGLSQQLQDAASLATDLRAQLAACERLAGQERRSSEEALAQLHAQHQVMAADVQQQRAAAAMCQAACEQKVQLLQQEHSLQTRELKAKHALEMDTIQVKLQGVLARKDATIAALRRELESVTLQMRHTDALLAEQQQELLADEDSHDDCSR